MLTQERLKELINYDCDSGIFTWIKKRAGINIEKQAGCIRKDGYRLIRIDNKLDYAHRIAWFYMTGNYPENLIDHINGNRDDNRFVNLRDVTSSVNLQNRKELNSKNTISGFAGVQKNHKKWQAIIWLNYKRILIGSFLTKEDAHQAYLDKKTEIHEGYVIQSYPI